MPDETNKVSLYYGTSLGPVSGIVVEESTNVAITGLIPRYETLRTTEFLVKGTLTFTGKTESDVGLRFSDTQAASFKVASGGKFYIEDATGTFGVNSGGVSSVSVDGGLASLNSNSGNITFNGISADNSAQIEVKTSVVDGESGSSTGGVATLSNAVISGDSSASVTASHGDAKASNIELNSSSLTLKSLISKTEEVDGAQSTTYYNATLDTLNATGAGKVTLETSGGTINLLNANYTGDASDIENSLITLTSETGGINIKNSNIENATLLLESGATGWRNGYFQNVTFSNSSVTATVAGENWIPLNMTLDNNSTFTYAGKQGRLFLNNDENTLSNVLKIHGGSSVNFVSDSQDNYMSTSMENGLVKLDLNNGSLDGQKKIFNIRTQAANSQSIVEVKNNSNMLVRELKFIMNSNSTESSLQLFNIDSSSKLSAESIVALAGDHIAASAIDLETGSLSGSWIKFDIDSSLSADSPLIALSSASGINADEGYLGILVDFSLTNVSLAADEYALISAEQAALDISTIYVKLSSGKIVEVSADENGLFVYDGGKLEDSFSFYLNGGEFGLSSYNFVPEPSTYSLLFGLAALILAARKRRLR